ncbi:LysR family transcriptional regulator [Lachnospiraceae bacterium ZAX-1]
MNIETLQYFRYIAKYKNITNAAKQLFVSQSTLSRHIMALENELGVKLFERNNKQMELTQAGQAFYKDSTSFVNHMETVIKNVQSADKGHSGILRVTIPSPLSYILSKPLLIMQEQHPDVKLVLEAYMFDEIPHAIQYDLYNIGLTYDFMAQEHENLESIFIADETFSLVVPSKYCTGQSKQTVSTIVASLPLTLPSHIEPPFLKKFISALQDYADTKIINTLYVNTTESVMVNISLGLCYSILPSSWIKALYPHTDITFMDLPNLSTTCKIVLLYKKANATELTNNFINLIKGTS